MFVQSHLLISEFLLQDLADSGIQIAQKPTPFSSIATIHPKRFRFGNIQPDLANLFIHYSHRISSASGYVVNLMNKLLVMDPVAESSEFSQILGVICHYLTDFFTYAHNDHFQGGIFKHLAYEHFLHRFMLNSSFPDTSNTAQFLPRQNATLSELLEQILSLHKQYIASPQSTPKRDCAYALFACRLACQNLIRLSMENFSFDAKPQKQIQGSFR